jgi:hypothetical protein
MINGNKGMEIRSQITVQEKEILSIALDGIYGWKFNPIAVITNGMEDYYFICKVKTAIKNLQMKMAKVHVVVNKDNNPQLLSIEGME